jgi:hypothetical protein
MEDFEETAVNRIFARAAHKVFSTLGPSCPAFAALLFRAQRDCHGSEDYLFAFVRSTKVEESGRAIYEAVPVEPYMLKHHESQSDILDMEDRVLSTFQHLQVELTCPYIDFGK